MFLNLLHMVLWQSTLQQDMGLRSVILSRVRETK